MAPMTTSVLRKDGVPERTVGLPKHTRPTVWQNAVAHGPIHGREAQGGKVGMPAVEVWGTRGREFVVSLEEQSYVVGSDPDSTHITLEDPQVSRVHAALDSIGPVWFVRDLGSRNGTFLNRDRVTGQRRLQHNDCVRIGQAELRYVDGDELVRPDTTPIDNDCPPLTRMERAVLLELCRPILCLDIIREAADVTDIASRLFIGRNAVQAHLTKMYDKFELAQHAGVNRRKLLAASAIQRGCVTRLDVGC